MTEMHMCLNNLTDSATFLSLFPSSNDYEFTAKKVFRCKKRHMCCDELMVHDGFDYARKKGFGKVKVGKQCCKKCSKQHHEDKSFWKDLLSKWQELTTSLVLTLRDSHVAWDVISKIMTFLIPCSKTKAISLFNARIDQFEYPQDNFVIVNYDEQHPKSGRTQKYRLTLLNYKTGIPIAEGLFDDKNDDTIKDFLTKSLDTTKEIVIITDCDRRYPAIFKELWGSKVIHQKCLLHLNKLIVKDFGSVTSINDEYSLYLLLNIFYNRRKELKYLEKLLKKQSKLTNKDNKKGWIEQKLSDFREYVKSLEHERRRNGKNLSQRPLWKAEDNLDQLLRQQQFFPKKVVARLHMIKKNWKYFTAFYSVEGCPATNNAIENYFSTSLKTHRKKQLRSDQGLVNHMKLAALKRVEGFNKTGRTFLQIFSLIRLLVT